MKVSGADNLDSKLLLIVEDDAIVGIGLKTYFEDLGATVSWATNLTDAEVLIESSDFSIAIVDLNLDGVMSTLVIDKLINTKVPVVLCTGYDVAHVEERFCALPRIEKPFTRSKIRSVLANLI